MKALKLLYKGKDIYIGTPAEIPIPAKAVLIHNLGPIEPSEEDVKKFKVKGEVIEGILIGKDEDEIRYFEKKHAISEFKHPQKRRKRRYRFRPPSYRSFPSTIYLPSEEFFYEYEYKGKIYILRGGIPFVLVWTWIEKDGKIIHPLLCGKITGYKVEGMYFYYSGYSKETKFLRFDKNLPSFVNSFGSNYGYIGEREKSIGWDPLPFPPYNIIGAVKLISWEKIRNKKEEKLPKIFEDIFILKSLLFSDEPVPVIKLSEGQLKKFASHVQREIYDPDSIAESPKDEYTNLLESCKDYVLLCQPKWPL